MTETKKEDAEGRRTARGSRASGGRSTNCAMPCARRSSSPPSPAGPWRSRLSKPRTGRPAGSPSWRPPRSRTAKRAGSQESLVGTRGTLLRPRTRPSEQPSRSSACAPGTLLRPRTRPLRGSRLEAPPAHLPRRLLRLHERAVLAVLCARHPSPSTKIQIRDPLGLLVSVGKLRADARRGTPARRAGTSTGPTARSFRPPTASWRVRAPACRAASGPSWSTTGSASSDSAAWRAASSPPSPLTIHCPRPAPKSSRRPATPAPREALAKP